MPLTAVLDEIVPAALPAISGDQADLLAAGCLVMPHNDLLSRYLAFDHYAERPIRDRLVPELARRDRHSESPHRRRAAPD